MGIYGLGLLALTNLVLYALRARNVLAVVMGGIAAALLLATEVKLLDLAARIEDATSSSMRPGYQAVARYDLWVAKSPS